MQDDLGFTALGTACQEGHTGIAHLLIEKGATVDYQNKVRLLYYVHYHYGDIDRMANNVTHCILCRQVISGSYSCG